MKIKTDFVTNSSSAAYIVAIPSNFIADKKDIIKYFESHDYDREGPWDHPKIYSEFYECLDMLNSGDNLWYYGDNGCDSAIFHTIVDICDEKGYLLSVFEIGGQGNNRIEGVKEEDINKWFMNTQLQKMTLEIKDEQN